jgi:hypothetical protein
LKHVQEPDQHEADQNQKNDVFTRVIQRAHLSKKNPSLPARIHDKYRLRSEVFNSPAYRLTENNPP